MDTIIVTRHAALIDYLIAEGLIMLADRKGPRAIQDKMNSFLDPAIHFNIDKSAK